MSDTLSEQLGPAAQNVEETMGGLVDSALGTADDSGRGTIMAATGGGMGLAAGMGGSGGGTHCHCHGDDTLHRDERTGEFVTPQLDHVERGGGSSDKRGSATRFMGDY